MTASVPRSVQDWFLLITEDRDDGKVVRLLLTELDDDELWPWLKLSDVPRRQHLLNLLTAVRLDQMAKENS
jgi:hypothetical protein